MNRSLRVLALLVFAFSSLAANAIPWTFQYKFANTNNVVTGTLTGDLNPDGTTLSNVSNVDIYFNGTQLIGSLSLLSGYFDQQYHGFLLGTPVVSTVAAQNNFFFIDDAGGGFNNYFYMAPVNGPNSITTQMRTGFPGQGEQHYVETIDGGGDWTLTSVPEPASLGLLGLGLAGIGFARRRKQKQGA